MNHNPLPVQVAAPAPGAPIRGRYPDVPSGLAREAFYAGPLHDRDVLVLVDSDDGLTRLHLLGEISFDRSDARLLVDRDRATLGTGIPVEPPENSLSQNPHEASVYDTAALELATLSSGADDGQHGRHANHHTPEAEPLAPLAASAPSTSSTPPPADPLGSTRMDLYDKIKLDFEQELGNWKLPTL